MGVSGFKIASLTAVSHLTKLLVTLFIIKQIAVTQGPAGLGLLGNFMSLVSIASSLAGGGVVAGVIKYLAEYSGSPQRQQSFIASSLLYTLSFALMTLCLGLLCINWITGYVFPNQDYRGYIYFFLVAQGLVALCNYSFGVANGLGKNSVYAGFLIGGNLVAVVVAFFAIQLYGLSGAVVAVMAPAVFPIIPAFVYVFRHRLISSFCKTLCSDSFFVVAHATHVPHPELERDLPNTQEILRKLGMTCKRLPFFHDSRLLFKFSIMLFASAVCFPVVEIIIRNQIVLILGMQSAGYWQAITKLSTAYLSFVSIFLTFYFLPLVSSIIEKKRIVLEVNHMMLFLGSCFTALIIVFFFFRNFVIHCVFSDEFLPISDLMLLQMVGDFFRVLGWVIGFVMVAKAATKLYLLGELFQGGIFLLFSHFALLTTASLQGVILAYVITCFLYCILSVMLFIYFFSEQQIENRKAVSY